MAIEYPGNVNENDELLIKIVGEITRNFGKNYWKKFEERHLYPNDFVRGVHKTGFI